MNDRYVSRAFGTLHKFLKDNVVRDKVLAKETTLRVGGPAAIFAVADSLDELNITVTTAKDWGLPLFVIGKGSNLLVSDSGFQGVIVRLGRDFMHKEISGAKMQAGAAASLQSLVQASSKSSLDGLCFAVGIPGSFGGALAMNAGALGGCMADVVKNVMVFSHTCEFKVLDRSQVDFGYRTSGLSKAGIIVGATLSLVPGGKDEIKRCMEGYFASRKSNQPLQLPSAGSTFKNPEGEAAGKLVEEAGCKGLRVGDAEVSTKHANFIVNLGHATASDVYSLLRMVQKRVFDHHGVVLEPEVELLGEFDDALILAGSE